jgi:hypothetical protein
LLDAACGFEARELVRQEVAKRSLSGNRNDGLRAGCGLLRAYGKRRGEQTRHRHKQEKPVSLPHRYESLLLYSSVEWFAAFSINLD